MISLSTSARFSAELTSLTVTHDRYVMAVTPRCRKCTVFGQLWPPISPHSYQLSTCDL